MEGGAWSVRRTVVATALAITIAAGVGVGTAFALRQPSAVCGITTSRSLGGRTYLLRLPAHTSCVEGRPLALAVVLHCYGCTADDEVTKFAAAADAHGMALAAPEGIGKSFNARYCCGPALGNRVDDSGFVDMIVAALVVEGRVDAGSIYATGFSNGGFMATYLVEPGQSTTKWAAVAPLGGHQYSVARQEPVAIALHHCETDMSVLASGCCASPSGGCCCGIRAPSCVSMDAVFEQWLVVNRCASTRTAAGPGGSLCRHGVGCAAETAACLYGGGCRHDWTSGFVGATDVLAFFARQRGPRGGSSLKAPPSAEDAAWIAFGAAAGTLVGLLVLGRVALTAYRRRKRALVPLHGNHATGEINARGFGADESDDQSIST